MVPSDFAANSPEGMCAAQIFAQSPAPPLIMIGRAALVPTQKFSINVVQVASTKAALVARRRS